MATVSFYQNVVVKDEKKIEEVKNALNSNTRPCSEIRNFITNEEEQKEIAKKWFLNLKK